MCTLGAPTAASHSDVMLSYRPCAVVRGNKAIVEIQYRNTFSEETHSSQYLVLASFCVGEVLIGVRTGRSDCFIWNSL